MRVGLGYDVHKLIKDRALILGGVEIPHTLGLLGHSDADVLVHAIMDALLGAAALGDIGQYFPDTDEAYKGISSMKLLSHVRNLLEQEGFFIENIDATVIAQKPKLRPYIVQMEQNIADTLKILKNQVNILNFVLNYTIMPPTMAPITSMDTAWSASCFLSRYTGMGKSFTFLFRWVTGSGIRKKASLL